MTDLLGPAPSEDELAAAPIIHLWELVPMKLEEFRDYHQVLGFIVGHPGMDDLVHAHTSPVMAIDGGKRPKWVRCQNRIYRLAESKAEYFKRIEGKDFRDWLYD